MQDIEKYGYFNLKGFKKTLLLWANAMPVNWLGRRLALILRKIVIKSLPKSQNCIDATIDSINMRVHIRDNVSERKFLFMPKFFDPYERQFIKKHLPKNGTFIDIGANAGIYSLTAGTHINDDGQILSIEPHPKMAERLTFNIELNQISHKVKILQYAITDKADTMSLMLDDGNMGGNSLTQKRGKNSIKVNCIPLHDLLLEQGIKQLDVMKIDIEGNEDNALIPFFNTAPKELYPKYIIMENSKDQWEQDLESHLNKKGYNIIHTSRMNCIWSL